MFMPLCLFTSRSIAISNFHSLVSTGSGLPVLHIDTMVLAPIQARETETIWLRYCCQLVRPQKFRLDKHFCQLNVKHCSKYIFNQSNTVMEISMWTDGCVILQGLQYVLHNTSFLLTMQPF